jgi:hypothetical protein
MKCPSSVRISLNLLTLTAIFLFAALPSHAQTATTTTVEANPSVSTYGTSVTIVATVSPSVPNAEGVTFYENGSMIGTAFTIGSVASYTTSTLPAGSDSLTAVYAGDANFAGSTSSPFTQTVSAASTTTALTSSLNPSSHGASVTFTATISPSAPNNETVSFYNGAAVIGKGFISGGVAMLTTSSLPGGSDSITASYGGDSNFTGSTSSPLTQTVTQIATTTTLASSLNPSTYLQSVTFTATVSPSVTLAEAVTFYDNGVAIGKGFVSGGVATLTVTNLPAGSDSITATYAGDASYAASTSSALAQVVNKAPTTTVLASSLNPSTYEQSVTFTAELSDYVPNMETVTFYSNGKVIGTGTTLHQVASLTTSALPGGSDSITVSYPGDANYLGSTSSPLTQTVNALTTSTSLTSSLNPTTYGQAVTFTATVSPTVPNDESVSFYANGVLIGKGFTRGGVASITTGTVPAGTDSIQATYIGDPDYASSTSSPLTQNVSQTATATVVTSSLNPSKPGQSVTFTATITPGVTNDETVSFYSNGVFIGKGFTSGGSATLTTSALPAGSDSITATYPGDANYIGSTSSPLTQTVTGGP